MASPLGVQRKPEEGDVLLGALLTLGCGAAVGHFGLKLRSCSVKRAKCAWPGRSPRARAVPIIYR